MKAFWRGAVAGAGIVILIVVFVIVLRFFADRDRKLIEYMEEQYELEMLQEDLGARPAGEFLENPAIRGAADSADAEFRSKRDEAIRRIRGGRVD